MDEMVYLVEPTLLGLVQPYLVFVVCVGAGVLLGHWLWHLVSKGPSTRKW
jgi:hypothetical protein